jgi:hypothetical protein
MNTEDCLKPKGLFIGHYMPLSIFCNSPYNEENNRAIKIFIQMPGDLLFHPRGE